MSLLALLPGGVCVGWRLLLFTKTLQSPEEAVRVATVKAFPVLLHHLGTSHHSLIGTTLLYVLLELLNENKHFCVFPMLTPLFCVWFRTDQD